MLLLLFAFVAGIFTILSPCILPILPTLLTAGTSKDKFRPLGIVIGLVVGFTFFTLSITAVVQALNLSANTLRYIAIITIFLFGLVMLVPVLSDLFAKITAVFGSLGISIPGKRKGLAGGMLLGIALGLVWTPCAGPILAAIVTLAATQAITLSALFLTLAYSIGAAIPMFFIAYGSGRIINSSQFLSTRSESLRRFFGGLMMLTAIAIAFHWDVILQNKIISIIPPILIEDNPLVKKNLENFPGGSAGQYGIQDHLTDYGKAPDISGIDHWINSSPLKLEELRGKVVLVDFWTYSCINCLRTLPYLEKWYADYKDKGLVIIGVHTPEFEFEKEPKNVADAALRYGIIYPIAQDNEYKTWLSYQNHYWPADYLIDKDGNLRLVHFGEGGYVEMENAIRSLLGMAMLYLQEPVKSIRPTTPETYLGILRGLENYTSENKLQPSRAARYAYQQPLENDQVGLSGEWNVEEDHITSEGGDSRLDLNFLARKVYLVLSGESKQPIVIFLDGQAAGQFFMDGDRKYDIVDVKYGRHRLSLAIPSGVSAYAFTFGDE